MLPTRSTFLAGDLAGRHPGCIHPQRRYHGATSSSDVVVPEPGAQNVSSSQFSQMLPLALFVAGGLVAGGCRAQMPTIAEDGSPAEQIAATPSHYSPWVVEVDGVARWRTISFKDVGLGLTDPNAPMSHPAVLEAIAESLAAELQMSPVAGPMTAASFDPAAADPAEHVVCANSHVYVDVWRGQNPDRWGYSLWSGCGEDDQFAWREIAEVAAPTGDALDWVQPLTRDIAAVLQTATHTGCFQRDCACGSTMAC